MYPKKSSYNRLPNPQRPVFDSDISKDTLIVSSDQTLRYKRLKRNLTRSAQIIEEELDFLSVYRKSIMVTLTYRDSDILWQPNDITDYICRVRNWINSLNRSIPLKKRGGKRAWFKYIWVIEQTKSGRPHYHVLFWLPNWLYFPYSDKRGWWSKGLTNQQKARNAVGYLVKYCSKCGSIFRPWDKGTRLFGIGGLTLTERDRYCYFRSPAWLKFSLGNHFFSVRKKGSYWVVEKKYCYSSPYSFDFKSSTVTWRGWQPIFEYLDCFPISNHSDFNFSNPFPFVSSPPKYSINSKFQRIRFIELVDSIPFVGYYDAIDHSIDLCSTQLS